MKAKGAGRATSGRRKTAEGLRERRTEQTRAREWSTGHVGPTGAAVLAQPQSSEDVTSEWSGVEAERGRRSLAGRAAAARSVAGTRGTGSLQTRGSRPD